MMRYLLDTNTLSDLYNNHSSNHAKITTRLQTLNENDEIMVSVLSLYEMSYALQNAPEHKQAKIKQGIDNISQSFVILPLVLRYTELFGQLKKQFKDQRTLNKESIKKHTLDIMLASCAISEGYILVSADKIFPALKQLNNQLQIKDWTQ